MVFFSLLIFIIMTDDKYDQGQNIKYDDGWYLSQIFCFLTFLGIYITTQIAFFINTKKHILVRISESSYGLFGLLFASTYCAAGLNFQTYITDSKNGYVTVDGISSNGAEMGGIFLTLTFILMLVRELLNIYFKD
ncbi:MAG: hypothetical protein CMG46_14110 [Candidatus Marinimicrobia bacterium]|nr:hypothetical protein [Candidatus Neomarinimicrobiota bacterium]